MEKVWRRFWFARCRWCTWEIQSDTRDDRDFYADKHERDAHPGTSREQAITIYWEERREV